MKNPIYYLASPASLLFLSLVLFSCTSTVEKSSDQEAQVETRDFSIGDENYVELTKQALGHLAEMDFHAWSAMLSDDVEYYFPDGDTGTRSVLKGKKELVDWWKNWAESSDMRSTTISNEVHVPLVANKPLNDSGLTGPFVLSYISTAVVYGDQTVSLRMHICAYFNGANLIDRYETYYDRAPIIEALEGKTLEASE
jgi:hypothetical protein